MPALLSSDCDSDVGAGLVPALLLTHVRVSKERAGTRPKDRAGTRPAPTDGVPAIHIILRELNNCINESSGTILLYFSVLGYLNM